VDETLAALEVVAATTGGLLTHRSLVAAGLSMHDISRLVRGRALVRVRRDTYRLPTSDADPLGDFRTVVRSVLARADPPILGGAAALVLHRLPIFGRPTTVHLCDEHRGGRASRGLTTTVAMPPRDQLVEVDGLLASGPARAALDTARLHSLTAGVVAADAALRSGATSLPELKAVAATMGGLRGIGRARLTCRLASPLSESPGESWSAVVMHQHGIPAPARQEVFHDAQGFIGRVDFWWPERRVIGEFDGRVKYGRTNPSGRPPEDVLWDEKLREDRLRRSGQALVRWTAADLHRPTDWIPRLIRALR
jgi:hypothetical protein